MDSISQTRVDTSVIRIDDEIMAQNKYVLEMDEKKNEFESFVLTFKKK